MGTYPVRYSGGEIICIGDEAELTLPDGNTRRIRIGALNSDYWNRAEGREFPHDIPRLNLEHNDKVLLWSSTIENPPQRLNPADLRLIRRSDKIFYNDGREMKPGDLIWENGEKRLYVFSGVWRKDDPDFSWFFDAGREDEFVLNFEPYSGDGCAFTCTYCDAEGNRSAAMDHITFIERGPRHLLREEP